MANREGAAKGAQTLTCGGEAKSLHPIRAWDPADVICPSIVGYRPSVEQGAHGDAAIFLHNVARAVLACEPAKHDDELVTLGAGGILRIRLMNGGGGPFLRSQRVRFPRGGRSYSVVQPLLLPVRRPFVAVRGHRADNAGLVREVQAAKLAVLLHSLVPLFFKNRASLMMDLVCRSKPFGGGLDLHSTADPHVYRQAKNCIGVS
jgi:hypothetical protein